MFLDFLFDVFRLNGQSEAVIWQGEKILYADLLERTNHWRNYLRAHQIEGGTVAAVQADFSPNAIALMLALIESGCIAVPLTSSVAARRNEFMTIAGAEALLEFDPNDRLELTHLERSQPH